MIGGWGERGKGMQYRGWGQERLFQTQAGGQMQMEDSGAGLHVLQTHRGV